MNIALVGYGKMGKIIEETAKVRGHHLVLIIDLDNLQDFTKENLSKADAAIEFTGPHSAFENIKNCLNAGIPTVCGSTGWLEHLDEIHALCTSKNGAFLYASNFSVGVNIFFEINRKLASMMEMQKDYEVSITEIHHTQKRDAPSGTAISLAEQVLENLSRKKKWVNHISDNPEELEILSERIDPEPGTHKVRYFSDIDDLEIIHKAHNRKGFALGAVLAAEFLKGKKGIFSMKDVLKL